MTDILVELEQQAKNRTSHAGMPDAWEHSVEYRAIQEITKLRAERDAAARDMREWCVQAVKNERLIDHTGAPEDNSYNIAIEHIVEAVEALPLIATDETGGAA